MHAIYAFLCLILDSLENSNDLRDEVFEMQPALITLFDRRNSEDLSAKESVKKHLWELHYADYGR